MPNSSLSGSVEYVNFLLCTEEIHVGMIWTYIATAFCIFLGTPAHSYFLWLSLRGGCKVKPTQMLPVLLRALELCSCVYMAFNIISVSIFLSVYGTFISLFFLSFSWISRLLLQVGICVEQYLAVLHPVAFLRYKSIRYRLAVASVAWLLGAMYGFCVIFGILSFPDNVFVCTCLGGVIVISFCYVAVLRALKHPGPANREITAGKNNDVRNQQKNNAFKTISAGLLTIVFSYSPLTAISAFRSLTKDSILFQCELAPAMLSLNIYSIVVPQLLKLYKEGHLKCIQHKV